MNDNLMNQWPIEFRCESGRGGAQEPRPDDQGISNRPDDDEFDEDEDDDEADDDADDDGADSQVDAS